MFFSRGLKQMEEYKGLSLTTQVFRVFFWFFRVSWEGSGLSLTNFGGSQSSSPWVFSFCCWVLLGFVRGFHVAHQK